MAHGELDWFADIQGRERRRPAGPLRHYRYAWVPKRHGELRLVEAPKPRLKSLQRRVLRCILDRIPAHDAAHGFCAGRSIKSFALPHAGRSVVLRMDLKDFFPSIRVPRVVAVFVSAGYPEAVARLLAGLCTNTAPVDLWDDPPDAVLGRRGWASQSLYSQPHLPQGAPTSPALANLCAFRLDCRLAALAHSAGAVYTRYADDLAFSGGPDFARAARRFHIRAAAIALEEGFRIHARKTRIMRAGVRQQLAGVVVNRCTNIVRRDYDRLKAIVCNCMRHGPVGQNRGGHENFRAHLAGRIAHAAMLNPERGRKLRAMFKQIVW
ncbi:MAG TPA: reverse transcriptase family protein [Pirellulales bacterium]|nr:reverse transcriptase family protein [Pirellulales bacterium]